MVNVGIEQSKGFKVLIVPYHQHAITSSLFSSPHFSIKRTTGSKRSTKDTINIIIIDNK